MLIKERPVITWLLNPDIKELPQGVKLSHVSNPINQILLNKDLSNLDIIRLKKPNWGLPELLMPSFERVMKKSISSFERIMSQLFHEFSEQKECGILLCKGNVTLVYRFEDDKLYLWYFVEKNGKSLLNFSSFNEIIGTQNRVGILYPIIADNNLFKGTLEERQNAIGSVANFIATYIAVKKYVKVETIIVSPGKFTDIEGTPLEYVDKKKVINQTGQEVIVMDSKRFRKIINDNDIYVRGFWRMQNKKNSEGEWYKELIFVDSFIRHGYHRNARIENTETDSIIQNDNIITN